MGTIGTGEPLARAVVAAIRAGDVEGLGRLLEEHPDLATTRLGDGDPGETARSLLHVATDWPGHFPRVAETIALLVAAGADPDARFRGPHEETPLHWAASSDDVVAIDALLDAGADIEAPGAVIAGGTPLTDATAFAQWHAAARLVERGARTSLQAAAALGLLDRVEASYATGSPAAGSPDAEATSIAFWSACHGGRLETAQYLLARGADVDVVPSWEPQTPLDAAARAEAHDVITWLHSVGAHTHSDLAGC